MLLETDIFYLEYKASFIQISSIASFNSFLIAWLRGYCTFSDSSVVSLNPHLDPNTPNTKHFPQKIMFYYQTFFLFQICSLLDCSQQLPEKKNRGSPCLFPHKLPSRVGMVLRSQSGWRICAAGFGTRNKANLDRSTHSRSSLFSVVFMCLISPTQKFILG